MGEMSKIEEVARAMWKRRVEFAASEGINLSDDDVGRMIIENGVLEEAKAAIEAMMVPTEAMIEAGFHEIKPDGLPADKGDAAACFTVMIDAALKE